MQAPVLNASHNLRPLLFATKELPLTSCVFGILGGGLKFESSRNHLLPQGTCATLSDEGDLPMLQPRMSRAGSSNSILQKCASVKTSPHTQSHGRLGFNGCDIPADIARARSSSPRRRTPSICSLTTTFCLVNLEPNRRSIPGNVPLDHVCVHVQASQLNCLPRDQSCPKTSVGLAPTIDVRRTCDLDWNDRPI